MQTDWRYHLTLHNAALSSLRLPRVNTCGNVTLCGNPMLMLPWEYHGNVTLGIPC